MNRQILEEASAWFIEFRTDSMNGATRTEFMQWLRHSPDHIRAYLEVSSTYAQLPKAGTLPDEQIQRLLDRAWARMDDQVTAFPNEKSSGRLANPPSNSGASRSEVSHARKRGAHIGLRSTAALAASALVLLVSGMWAWTHLVRGVYSTAIGEQRMLTLEDGSRVDLNARSRVRIRYSPRSRAIDLIEGQALFQVAKDVRRPFIVHTGAAEVRAVGTQFDVDSSGGSTTVTVLEGTVTVVPGSAAPPRTLSAGDQTLVTTQGGVRPHRTNVAAVTAWRRGEFEFDETPLANVAEQFNRYSARRLILESPEVASVRISGVYSSADPVSLILFLRNQPDLLVSESPGVIHIRLK